MFCCSRLTDSCLWLWLCLDMCLGMYLTKMCPPPCMPLLHWNFIQLNLHAHSAGYGTQSQMCGKPAPCNGMGRGRNASFNSFFKSFIDHFKSVKLNFRHIKTDFIQHFIIFRSTKFICGHPQNIHQISLHFGVKGYTFFNILNNTCGRELNGFKGGYLNGFTIFPLQIAVNIHAVLSGKQRNTIGKTGIFQCPACPDKLGSLELTVRIVSWMILNIRPAEIVHPSDMGESPAHGNHAAHRFINCTGHHVIRINF